MYDRKTLNTVEELVQAAWEYETNTHLYKEHKYSLRARRETEWVDKTAARAWREEENALYEKYGFSIDVRSEEGKQAYKEWQEQKPPMVTTVFYSLKGDRNTRVFYTLSTELGEQLDVAWTKSKGRYGGGESFVGWLTLPGMVKRLGQGGALAERVKAEKIRQVEAEKVRKQELYAARALENIKSLRENVRLAKEQGLLAAVDAELTSISLLERALSGNWS